MGWRGSIPALVLVLLTASAGSDDGFRVRAVQHGGWWEVRYPDGTIAANELHIPTGRRVVVEATLDGGGIIWFDDGHLPRVGRRATVAFSASGHDRAIAHALHLRQPRDAELTIIGDEQFDQWLAAQKRDAAEPTDAQAARGRAVFLTARCTLCHSVRGVAVAEEPVGPDLTHVASRSTLAAGALPNGTGPLAGWVVDAETIKPGAGMPVNNIDASELQALLSYLQGLR
jgi:cytochrome c oxidase subunit 2